MRTKRIVRYFIWTAAIIALAWTILTLYVEGKGPEKDLSFGPGDGKKVLIVFDPDPFYNLDEQVCSSFAKALAENNISARVASVISAEKLDGNSFDLYVYCANTYNWRPDWAITGFIENNSLVTANKPAVAITLGAGSTEASQRTLEKVITNSGGKIKASYSLWLWRPNNEEKMEQPNVDVAVQMAHEWGKLIAEQVK